MKEPQFHEKGLATFFLRVLRELRKGVDLLGPWCITDFI